VTQARADLAGATLDAPITGTVGQVSLTVGQSDSAGSVVIVGGGAVSVTVDVPVADMPLVHQGLTAEVTPAGDLLPVAGTVSGVSPLPVSSTTTTPLYPVVVTVPNPPQAMASGSTATVAITVGEASDAVRVPVSAIAGLQTGTGTVQVLRAVGPQTQAVTVGAVGGGYAQVLSGLREGDRVVLADLTAALPSNQTVNVRGLVGGGAGFGGAARAGGGGTGGTGGTGGAAGTSNGGTGGSAPRGAG
jgi:multidrug efflux pump subunit AcrA (membrane-fusion protein)